MFGETGDSYEGQWKNGRVSSSNVLWADRRVVRLSFFQTTNTYIQRTQADGYGVMTWTRGTRYEGLWKENRRCGKGTYYYLDGLVYEGEWRDNKCVGRRLMDGWGG